MNGWGRFGCVEMEIVLGWTSFKKIKIKIKAFNTTKSVFMIGSGDNWGS